MIWNVAANKAINDWYITLKVFLEHLLHINCMMVWGIWCHIKCREISPTQNWVVYDTLILRNNFSTIIFVKKKTNIITPSVWLGGYRDRGSGTVNFAMNGPHARYVKLRVAHAPGMPGTISPPPLKSDPDMHHGMCVTHVPWCMPGSLYSGFLWSRWQGKRSRHSRRMRNPQFYVSGKRPMAAPAKNIFTLIFSGDSSRFTSCCIGNATVF